MRSVDFVVWHAAERPSQKEAVKIFVRLLEGDTAVVRPHPGVGRFLVDLRRSEDDDSDAWSAPVRSSEGHVCLSVGARLSEMRYKIQRLASKNGLSVVDSETKTVNFPGDPPTETPWWEKW